MTIHRIYVQCHNILYILVMEVWQELHLEWKICGISRPILKEKHTRDVSSVVLSHFTLTMVSVGRLFWAGGERHAWQYREVGVQRGRRDQALWRGHRCNGHLRHISSRNIQRLRFAGRTDPPHLSKKENGFPNASPISTWIHLVQLSVNQHSWGLNAGQKCLTVPVTSNRSNEKTHNFLFLKTPNGSFGFFFSGRGQKKYSVYSPLLFAACPVVSFVKID